MTDSTLTTCLKKNVFHLKDAGLLYDISSGCIIVPKTAGSVDIYDRAGEEVVPDSLKPGADKTKTKIDFSLGADGKYTLMSGKEFKPWFLHMAIGSGAAAKESAIKSATDNVATKTIAKEAADAAVAAGSTTEKISHPNSCEG
jgi:hypothetical protein